MLCAARVASLNRSGRSSFIRWSTRSDSSAVLRSWISTGTRNATNTTAAAAMTPTSISMTMLPPTHCHPERSEGSRLHAHIRFFASLRMTSQPRPLQMPLRRLLVGVRSAKYLLLLERPADEEKVLRAAYAYEQ